MSVFVTPVAAVRLGIESWKSGEDSPCLLRLFPKIKPIVGIKKGDRVKIKGYSEKLNGKLGFVLSVSGAYYLVKPRWSQYAVELLENEVEKF